MNGRMIKLSFLFNKVYNFFLKYLQFNEIKIIQITIKQNNKSSVCKATVILKKYELGLNKLMNTQMLN